MRNIIRYRVATIYSLAEIIKKMEIDNIIAELKNLDLTTEPTAKITDLFSKVGKVGYIIITLNKGKTLMRARPNENGERFTNSKQLSYKPQELNKTYQRASTPNKTMFYGTFLPDKIDEGELNNARIISAVESMPWIRDKTTTGYRNITFGRWTVKAELTLIAIVHKDTFYKESNYTRELVNSYNEFIKNEDKTIIEKSLKFHYFLADEFSKDIIQHTDYIISAKFVELATEYDHIDGFLYPSLRVAGKGFNVAIKPTSCSKLGLTVVGECSVYKIKDHTVIGNDCKAELNGNTDEFVLENIESDRHACLAQLGIQSISDLK